MRTLGGPKTTGQLACLAASACYGLGFTYLHKQIAPREVQGSAVALVVLGVAVSPARLKRTAAR